MNIKNLSKSLILLAVLGTAASCSKDDPIIITETVEKNAIADYEIVQDPNDAFTFTFKNLSSEYSRLEWRFGDDTLKTDENPTHTYLATGRYTVDLKAFSETGVESRKMIDLNIIPDSVVKITTSKTEVANQIKFHLDVKAPVESVRWTFNGTNPTTDTSLDPVRTFVPGSFNSFTVTVTTTKGSVVTVSKFITTEGIAEDITQKRSGFTPSSDNSNTNENAAKFIDGNLNTKFLVGSNTFPLSVNFQFDSPQAVKLYAIGSGNDSQDRDPREWTLQGSNDGDTWEVLDTRVMTKTFFDQSIDLGRTGDARWKQLFYFTVAEPKPFLFYRWRVTSNFGSGAFQASEIRLYR